MKDILRRLLAREPDAAAGRNIAREYLQVRILQLLQDQGAFVNWCFLGGTALRFLYQLPRHSEDLDFSLTEAGAPHEFEKRMRKLKSAFEAEAYAIDLKVRTTGAVAAAFVKFKGLLHEMDLSPHVDEVISVKIEVDTNPPSGAGTETSVVRRYVTVRLLHHDRPSLLSGKLHAVLTRSYTKGRDLFDLAWYLADRRWPPPNLVLLNNALRQTGGDASEVTAGNWRQLVAERLAQLDWDRAIADVAPFLERRADLAIVDRESVLSLLLKR